MWQIIRNEWRFLSHSRQLLGISIGFVLLLALSVFWGNVQTQKQQEAYQKAKNHLRKQWESIQQMNPHNAAHYGTYVFRPSHLLSGLDEGVNSVMGNVLRLEGHVQNEMAHSEAAQMQAVSKFGKLRSVLLLQYITPLLLIFLAFHSISGEKQSGRLKLLVLQGAKPLDIVLAKTLSVWLYGIGLLALVASCHAALNIQQLNGDSLARIGLFFSAYALYYLIVVGLTVFFSARWQNPTLALTAMLGIWIIWTIFLPSILMSAVENRYPLPSRDAFKTAMKDDRAKGIDGHNPADDREKELEKAVLKKYGVDSLSQLPINFDGLVMQADEDYGNKVWDKHFGSLRAILSQQKGSYQLGGILTPFIALQNASMGFAATDNLHHQAFLLQAERYRRVFIKTLNDKHAYGGSKTGDWDWMAGNDFFRSVPDFDPQPAAIAAVLPNYIPDLIILVCWGLLAIALLGFRAKEIQLI